MRFKNILLVVVIIGFAGVHGIAYAQQSTLNSHKKVPKPERKSIDTVRYETANYYNISKTDTVIKMPQKPLPAIPKSQTRNYYKPFKKPYPKKEE